MTDSIQLLQTWEKTITTPHCTCVVY